MFHRTKSARIWIKNHLTCFFVLFSQKVTYLTLSMTSASRLQVFFRATIVVTSSLHADNWFIYFSVSKFAPYLLPWLTNIGLWHDFVCTQFLWRFEKGFINHLTGSVPLNCSAILFKFCFDPNFACFKKCDLALVRVSPAFVSTCLLASKSHLFPITDRYQHHSLSIFKRSRQMNVCLTKALLAPEAYFPRNVKDIYKFGVVITILCQCLATFSELFLKLLELNYK